MHHSTIKQCVGVLLLLFVFAMAGASIVMLIWNAVVAGVCDAMTVSFAQALGLLMLGWTLSGGLLFILALLIHPFVHYRHDSRRTLFEKWHGMTEEQRRRFLSSRGFKIDDTED